jgi:hypothetical protein
MLQIKDYWCYRIEAQQYADVVVADIDPSCMKKPTKDYVEPVSSVVYYI